MNYVALFRGINVGGKNIVKMKELEQLLLDLGLEKIKTYIQSGNAIFETDLEEATLQKEISTGFLERFGFESNVILRSWNEIKSLVEQLPISKEEIMAAEEKDSSVEHLYVYFLNDPPLQVQLDAVCKEYIGSDILCAGKREVYLLCKESIRKSKLAIKTGKIFDSATVRNWKTVTKLYDLLKEL